MLACWNCLPTTGPVRSFGRSNLHKAAANLAAISGAANSFGLEVFGTFHTTPDEGFGAGTMVMFGPNGPKFWPTFKGSFEYADGLTDPIDRWSKRVLTDIAKRFSGTTHFPFGGPPYAPFYTWALRTGRAWQSPVQLLVHDKAGLWASYRGAIHFDEEFANEVPKASPCQTCLGKPCLTACPVGALNENRYEVASCHSFLDQPRGTSCMQNGCKVRASCPVSVAYERANDQSAYHMKVFHI